MAESIVLLRNTSRGRAVDQRHGVQHDSTKFLRKTAKGRIFKVLREHYLRNDIPCGSSACSQCDDLYASQSLPTLNDAHDDRETTGRSASATGPVLSREGRPRLGQDIGPHYVVLDTNVALHQMDVVESPLFGTDVIVLQNVLDEVRHRSLPLYNRVMVLLAEPSRRFYCFANDACAEAFIQPTAGETPNDSNDRAIREACQWYGAHLSNQQRAAKRRKVDSSDHAVGVVLISDDADNRRRASAAGIQAYSTRAYVEMLPKDISSSLTELLSEVGGDDNRYDIAARPRRAAIYDEYLSAADLQAGVRSGQLHSGHFSPNAYNYLEGFVNVPTFAKPVLLLGRENMNRATDGDVVVVSLFPESEWKASADEVLDQDVTLRNDDPEESEDDEDVDGEAAARRRENASSAAQSRRAGDRQPTGRVVGVLKRAWRSYVCHLDRSSIGPAASASTARQSVFATPVDRKFPKIRIHTRQAGSLAGQKFLVTVDRWDTSSRYPEGHFVRVLGRVESKEAEIESLLLEFDVPYRPFSRAVLDCLPAVGDSWRVPSREEGGAAWAGREDLRDLLICSIDPPGCQDIDDALHARSLPNGNIEAGVHIADVSYFVHPDNPMDAEAASRGTTVYLVDKRIDMLPSLLGTNLCSLRPHVERLAFSVIWELNSDADIINVRFGKSVIASKEAFTYQQAQDRIDDASLEDPLTTSVRLLNKLAIKLRAKRMAAGALNLASPEVKIHLDSSESTGPIDVEQKKPLQTNSLVEEFMLLANISVAERIYQQFPATAVLRRHAPPPSTNFDVLKDVLSKRKGLELDVSSSGTLAASLDRCVDPSIPEFNTLVRIMATRCMLSAEYFCSGSIARDVFRHYGLATHMYTHFTSPIRRYADVLVHRELMAAISNSPLHTALHSKSHVDRVMDNINKRHRAAQQAGRASVEFYVALALRQREESSVKAGLGKIREEAFVIRAFRNGVAVFVSRFGLEGVVMFKRDHTYDSERYEIVVPAEEAMGEEVRVGVFDKVMVEITVERDRSTQRGRVRMSLVEPVNSQAL